MPPQDTIERAVSQISLFSTAFRMMLKAAERELLLAVERSSPNFESVRTTPILGRERHAAPRRKARLRGR